MGIIKQGDIYECDHCKGKFQSPFDIRPDTWFKVERFIEEMGMPNPVYFCSWACMSHYARRQAKPKEMADLAEGFRRLATDVWMIVGNNGQVRDEVYYADRDSAKLEVEKRNFVNGAWTDRVDQSMYVVDDWVAVRVMRFEFAEFKGKGKADDALTS